VSSAESERDQPVAIELRLDRLVQLYNSLDPSPFKEKELDQAADDYIVGSAEELAGKKIRLVVLLTPLELERTTTADVVSSIHHHFEWREQAERRRLHSELRRGRRSLLVGLAFLASCLAGRQLLPLPDTGFGNIVREGLLIVGWVAMWGPLEIFLYGWWPIASRRRMLRRLASVEIEVRPLKEAEDRSSGSGRQR